MIIAFSNY